MIKQNIIPFLTILIITIFGILSLILEKNTWLDLGIICFFIIFYYFVIRKEIKEDLFKLLTKFEKIEKQFERREERLEKVLKK